METVGWREPCRRSFSPDRRSSNQLSPASRSGWGKTPMSTTGCSRPPVGDRGNQNAPRICGSRSTCAPITCRHRLWRDGPTKRPRSGPSSTASLPINIFPIGLPTCSMRQFSATGSARAQARPDQPLVIGRERGCQLVVDDPLVSRRHAEVVFAEDGWLLRDLGSRNGTFVEGQRSAYVAVTDGGEVRLGNAEQGPIVRFAFVHRDPAEMTQDGADSSGALAVPAVSVRMPTAEHEAAERIRIGRGAGNDIALTDLKASRNHAEVRRTGEVHEVVDLGSRN